ncbi:unnamed protein product [Phyllotreta striolata]|uniref:Transporter n=1 Tax=Phyllotreta striolata TaxID=444603 RepID=A0A9N9TT00_PHYSR|nr:unnamed protein product [Phyllotreta striolata]
MYEMETKRDMEKSSNSKNELPERAKWKNKTEFLLSCLGYSIGIGSVWRFPYVCYSNGGGAFLIPYLLMLFFCGIPLFFIETSLGQFASVGCISFFKICPLFKGAGYAILVVNFIVCSYFNMLMAYPVIFLAYCFKEQLPWSNCDNPWNTNDCAQFRKNTTFIGGVNNTNSFFVGKKTPADEFFHRRILEISPNPDDIGQIVWPLLFSDVFCWIVTYLCIIKGVKSVGKVVYFTAPFPFVILIILFIRGVTLPGAWDGIKFYIVPEWSRLTSVKVWSDAAIQIFYTLGPGWGGLVNLASYNDFRNNGRLDAFVIPVVNCGSSIFAGFVVFSVLGFLAHETGLPVSAVVAGGPALSFITYPEAISLLPLPHLWAILFFLMLFFLAIDSLFVQIEAIVTGLSDEFEIFRKKQHFLTAFIVVVLIFGSTLYTTNAGIYWLQIFDWYAAAITVILVCFLEVFIVSWIYGIAKYKRDIEFMLQEKIETFWIVAWKYVAPVFLLFIFIMTIAFNTRVKYNNNNNYPDWMITIGWCSCGASLMCIPIYIVAKLLFFEEGTLMERLKSSLKSVNWEPANPINKADWKAFISGQTEGLRSQQLLELNVKETI